MKNQINKYFFITYNEVINQRIDNFLITKIKKLSRNTIYCIIRKGKILINGKKINHKYKLKEFDVISIPIEYQNIRKQENIFIKKKDYELITKSIIYEDNDLLILNKPSGIAVHGGSGINFSIVKYLKFLYTNFNFLEIAHRLDKHTSGILLVAKNRLALKNLHEQFRHGEIKKYYLALVHGTWQKEIKSISTFLNKNIINDKKHLIKIDDIGKFSKTYFKIEKYFKNFTLMKINPITGRTHQIRVHTKYIGNPIVFDNKYGNSILDNNIQLHGKRRLFLHAYIYYFKHPINKQELKIRAPIDEILTLYLKLIRKTEK